MSDDDEMNLNFRLSRWDAFLCVTNKANTEQLRWFIQVLDSFVFRALSILLHALT